MARIRLAGIAKRFDTQTVVAPLDLAIEDGEFFTFVGPSGCGKSTLLGLLAGIEAPSAGTLYFDDQAVNDLAPRERDVAMVFQSYALYPHLSVRENIGFPLKVRRVPRREIDRDVERMAELLKLGGLLERKPRELSGGQRQRVALGRALVRRPRLFLMDEPLSNLDARLRLEMREEFKRLHETFAITTIYVTHDQEEAMALSQRMAVLSAGAIQQCGKPQQVYDEPANLFVAQFVGSPPINLFQGAGLTELPGAAALLGARAESAVIIGVRPADVIVQAEPASDALAAEVALVAPTGSDLWVVGSWRGQRIEGRAIQGLQPRRGATVHFRIPAERVYVFDRETGARVRGLSAREATKSSRETNR